MSSVHSHDRLSDYSSSSAWTTTYKKLPKKQPMSLKFLSWAAGAPRGATVMKKRTRDFPDDRSSRSGWSSASYYDDGYTQLYWVAAPSTRSYSSSSSASSTTSRRSKPKRTHFDGRMPPPPPPGMGMGFMPPPPDGHFSPPPMAPSPGFHPMHEEMMDDHFHGHPGHMGGGMYGAVPPPPPPPPPMNGPPGDAPAFFDLTGQGGRGFRPGPDDDWDDESVYTDSVYDA